MSQSLVTSRGQGNGKRPPLGRRVSARLAVTPPERRESDLWGTYFPAEYVPEFDAIEWEQISKAAEKDELREFQQGQEAAKVGPFDVVNVVGVVVATYDDRWRAVGCLNRHRLQPSYVLQNGIVIARRETAPVQVGDAVEIVTELTEVALALAMMPDCESAA